MIVLDTNVISELMRPRPADSVVAWISAQPSASQYTTTITQAEILYGILQLPAGRRRNGLRDAAEAMFTEDFAGRLLGFGSDAALAYAQIASDRRRRGRPISHFDAQIAAIVRTHGGTLVTRNVSDFQGCALALVNPWEA